MIENALSFDELHQFIGSFLRLNPQEILRSLERVLNTSIKSLDEVVCQNRVLVSYRGYRIDIRDLRPIAEIGLSVLIQFRAKQRWFHGFFWDQNKQIVQDLQRICQSHVKELTFKEFRHNNGSFDTVFLYDSRAFNPDWKEGFDLSPLLIAPDAHDGKCFIEFLFNPGGYVRSGDEILLNKNWLSNSYSISKGIHEDAQRLVELGRERSNEKIDPA